MLGRQTLGSIGRNEAVRIMRRRGEEEEREEDDGENGRRDEGVGRNAFLWIHMYMHVC